MKFTKLRLPTLVLLLSGWTASAQVPDAPDLQKAFVSFRMTTETLAVNEPSKEALAEWYLNMINMDRVVVNDLLQKDINRDYPRAERLAFLIVNTAVSAWLTDILYTPMHERAHAEAAAANGATSTWFSTHSKPQDRVTIGELYLKMIGGDLGGMTHFSGELTRVGNARFEAAGLNQQALFAEELSFQTVENGNFNVSDYVHYFANKMSIPIYYVALKHDPTSDLTHYATDLSQLGKTPGLDNAGATRKMFQYSMASALLSGRGWEGFHAMVNYVQTGNTQVDTMSFQTPLGEISWPEITTFLNDMGISIKAETRLKTSETRSTYLSVEKSVVGDQIIEVGAGEKFVVGSTTLSAGVVASSQKRYGIKLGFLRDLDGKHRWFLFGDVDRDNGTLDGLRLNYQNDKPVTRANVGVGYRN